MDIDSKLKALKAGWVIRLLNSNSTIRKIFKGILPNLNKTLTIPYKLKFSEKSPDKLQKIGQIPLFYIQILGALNECKKTQTLGKITRSKLLQQPIWNNSLLLYKGQSLFFKTWMNNGILYFKDMIGDDDKLIDIKDFSKILENKSIGYVNMVFLRTLVPVIKRIKLFL